MDALSVFLSVILCRTAAVAATITVTPTLTDPTTTLTLPEANRQARQAGIQEGLPQQQVKAMAQGRLAATSSHSTASSQLVR